jgi:hypothetical protein
MLQPILSILEQATISAAACPPSGNGQEGARLEGAGKSDDEMRILAVTTDFAQFRCLKGRCSSCWESTAMCVLFVMESAAKNALVRHSILQRKHMCVIGACTISAPIILKKSMSCCVQYKGARCALSAAVFWKEL